MTPYIELRHICKRFAGVVALKDVSIDVHLGEVHALMGENGAGKSTLIKVMAGFHQPTSGECYVQGEKVEISNPKVALGLRIGVVYQELNVVDSLSVAENIFFGRLPCNRFGQVNWKKLYQQSQEILDRLGLNIPVRRKVGSLSTAQKQLVEIARCLSQDPQFLIMDEPTSSLAPKEIQTVLEIVARLRKQNVGILYISHKLDEVFAISDRITVLRDGEYVATHPTKEMDEQQLIALMVGRTLSLERMRKGEPQKEIGLEVKNLTTAQVKNINFHAYRGEIVGFSGLMGAGRTELAKALFGIDHRVSGEITIHGAPLPADSIPTSVRMGMGFVPESRKEEGIFQNFSVMKNLTISTLSEMSHMGITNVGKEAEISEKYRKAIRIKTPTIDQMIVNLSGGNQQKVIIARWLAKEDLKILIVDEPTRGIDVGAKSEIYALLDELARNGLTVLIMSSEMQEILSICDRIYVMKNGRITDEVPIEEATQEKLLSSAI